MKIACGQEPWGLGWRSNRLLLWAVGVELLALVGFLLITHVATLLDQAIPPIGGFAVAVLAAPFVLAADAVRQRARRISRQRRAPH